MVDLGSPWQMAGGPLAQPLGTHTKAAVFQAPPDATIGSPFWSGRRCVLLENISRLLRNEYVQGHLSRLESISLIAPGGSIGKVQFQCTDRGGRGGAADASFVAKSIHL